MNKLTILLATVLTILLALNSASAWVTGFDYRKQISIDSSPDGALTDYQVNLTVLYSSNMQADFDDLRFYETDDITSIPYWLESKTDSSIAHVWINTSVPASGGKTVNMYYGNATLSSSSDGSATFLQYLTALPGTSTTGSFGTNTAMRFSVAYNGANQHHGYYLASGSPERLSISCSAAQNPNIKLYSAALTWRDIGAGDMSSTYHIYDVMRNGSTNVITVYDDTTITIHSTHSSTAVQTQSLGTFPFMWSVVRKYTGHEPTKTFGPEVDRPYVPQYDYWNSKTNNTALTFSLAEDEQVTFTINNTIDNPTLYTWFKDGVDQNNNLLIFTTSWSTWGSNAEVIFYATNATTTSDNITWNPMILIARASGTPETVAITRSNEFVEGVNEFNLETMLGAEMYLYVDLMGPFFFLLIIGVPFVMIWIRTESLVIPGGLGTILGGILILFMPTSYQGPIILILIVSIGSILLGIYKDRR